jgi:hypothetical protein
VLIEEVLRVSTELKETRRRGTDVPDH